MSASVYCRVNCCVWNVSQRRTSDVGQMYFVCLQEFSQLTSTSTIWNQNINKQILNSTNWNILWITAIENRIWIWIWISMSTAFLGGTLIKTHLLRRCRNFY